MGGNERSIGRGAVAIALTTVLAGGALAAVGSGGLPEAFAGNATQATGQYADPDSTALTGHDENSPLTPNQAGPLAQIGQLVSRNPAKAVAHLGAARPVMWAPIVRKTAGREPENAAKVAESASASRRDTQSEAATPRHPSSSEAERDAALAPENNDESGSRVSSDAEPTEPGASSAERGAGPLSPRTLVIGGRVIPYGDVRGGTTPDTGAGLWLGTDSTADGSWGYFVGHNPGSFAPVMGLGNGSAVTLCDSERNVRTYTVRVVFTVDANATWKAIAPRVTGFGESVILQTCTGDGTTNTIVVAA